MDQPQVLGTIPRSTLGRRKKGGRNRTKEQSSQALAYRPVRRGGLSAQATRTVRQGTVDCPHRYGGPSGLGRGLSVKANRTSSSEPRKNGPSAGSTRTIRQAPADCPHLCCGPSETSSNQNSAPADCPPAPRGLSTPHGQRQEQRDPEGQHHQLITGSPKR
jgi:hypothetical protein